MKAWVSMPWVESRRIYKATMIFARCSARVSTEHACVKRGTYPNVYTSTMAQGWWLLLIFFIIYVNWILNLVLFLPFLEQLIWHFSRTLRRYGQDYSPPISCEMQYASVKEGTGSAWHLDSNCGATWYYVCHVNLLCSNEAYTLTYWMLQPHAKFRVHRFTCYMYSLVIVLLASSFVSVCTPRIAQLTGQKHWRLSPPEDADHPNTDRDSVWHFASSYEVV